MAVLMGLTALAAGVAPRQATRDPGVSPSPAADGPPPVERVLDAASSGQDVGARVGQNDVITGESDVLDSVKLGELEIETADPQSPARFELLADVPGSYPIELLEAERRIGTLEIRPARG